ncbi:MAG: hypothetical protein KJ069_24625 [Anaerolineae bacterium]|nr:hypothetical protein [Anaerolineae bacterium]
MIDRVTPHLITLVYDAALKSFWRKSALRKFLGECRISSNFLATWGQDESKREFLDRVFATLQKTDNGRKIILQMAVFLAEQESFPDLQNWEDSAQKVKEATNSVRSLRLYVEKQEEELQQRRDKEEAQQRFRERQSEVRRSQTDLQILNSRIDELAKKVGSQQAGYDFQDWFFDLLDFSEIVNRRPYWHDGRQIDGTTYLIELKFTEKQADAPDVDTFLSKVNDKADNTMGVMVSMAGYSSVAKKTASKPKTPLLLLDHSHIYLILSGVMSLADVIDRIRRHSSQTSEAYLSASDFGGK